MKVKNVVIGMSPTQVIAALENHLATALKNVFNWYFMNVGN